MKIELANTLFDEGVFTELYKAGFISEKIFHYREIYLWIDAQKKARGITEQQARIEAEDKFKKNERTIRRALNCFN